MSTHAPSATPPPSAFAARASILRNVIANWAGLGVNALLSLVLTPILLHGLGNLYFGMFMLVASVLDSCWLLDFGMRTAMFRYLARHRGSGEREELDRTFASGMVIACCSATLILLAALAAVFVAPRFFAVSPADRPVFRALLLLAGGSVAAAFLAQILGTYLFAFRRFDFYNLNSAVTGILRAVLIVVALHLHGGVLGVAAVTLGCSLLSLLTTSRLVHIADHRARFLVAQHLPQPHSRTPRLQRQRVPGHPGRSDALLRGLGCHRARAGHRLHHAVRHSRTPDGSVSRTGVFLASPLAGVMSELSGRRDEDALRFSFLRATRLCLLLSLFVSLLLLVNGVALIRLWGGAWLREFRIR